LHIDHSIQSNGDVHFVEIALNDETVQTETGAVWSFQGALQITNGLVPPKIFFKAHFNRQQLNKPSYSGSGKLFFAPSFRTFFELPLKEEAFILNPNTYLASEPTVQTLSTVDQSIPGLKRGKGLTETLLQGNGKVIVSSPGPVECVTLKEETFGVNGALLIARSAGLKATVQKSLQGGQILHFPYEEFFYRFQGTGTVFYAPLPSKNVLLEAQMKKGKKSPFFSRSILSWCKKRIW